MGIAAALVGALSRVPAPAVPGLVDALLLTTQCSASSLLLDFLLLFPDIHQNVCDPESPCLKEDGETIHAYLTALFHLLKSDGREAGNFGKVMWTVCVPLLRSRDSKLRSLQVEVAEMLAQATVERSDWDAVKSSLAPLCLQSLYPQLPWLRESAPPAKTVASRAWQQLEKKYSVDPRLSTVDYEGKLLSTYAVCQLFGTLVAAALDASSRSCLVTSDMVKVNGDSMCTARKFCEESVAMFLAPALSMLAQPLDGSVLQCAVQNLLPSLLTASVKFGWLNDVSPEARAVESRKSSLQEVWRCCQALLCHGPSQRHDVYMTLASLSDLLFPAGLLSLSSETDANQLTVERVEVFDIRNESQFWEELRTGLADADSLTRKRALFILRKALPGIQLSDVSAPYDANQISCWSNGSGNSVGPSNHKSSKRNKWAEEEAGYLGVGAVRKKLTMTDGWRQRWDAFILLHETLEEYGIHLVEAAWLHQMSFLLQFTKPKGDAKDAGPYWTGNPSQKKASAVDVNFMWISVLWQRGFDHKNPQVRRLVMQSFLDIEWERIRKLSSLLPENVVLGPVLEALDDPVHHRDFGMKGIYSSLTAEGAAKFMGAFSSSLPSRRRAGFVGRMAKAILAKNRGRAGFMTQAICLEAAALGSSAGIVPVSDFLVEQTSAAIDLGNEQGDEGPACLLDLLRSVVENCIHHFNPNYRAEVCGHALRAASALVALLSIPFVKFAYFITAFPNDQMVQGGSLHHLLLSWIQADGTAGGSGSAPRIDRWMVEGLHNMADTFLRSPGFLSSAVTDEDVESWGLEAQRWTKVLALGLVDGINGQHMISLIQRNAYQIYSHAYMSACTPERVLLLLRSLLREFTPSTDSCGDCALKVNVENRTRPLRPGDTRITEMVLIIMDELKSYARRSTAAFWEHEQVGLSELPAAVSGKLGGPSQRRLPPHLTSAVLQGVLAISTLSECSIWCCRVGCLADIPESLVTYLWEFAWEVVTTPRIITQIGAELQLAALQAFTCACSALAKTATPFYVKAAYTSIKFESKTGAYLPDRPDKMVDGLLTAFLRSIADSAFISGLTRSRRAILYEYKWSSVDTLLSIPRQSLSGHQKFRRDINLSSAISTSMLAGIFKDCIESLESAGEEYLLPLLRSIRWLMHWEIIARVETDEDQDKYQVMWNLVQAGWSAMVDCNKRRVAPTAAFLSAIFHPAVFGDFRMHGSPEDKEECGPLKWLLNRLIDQGSRSPRTMRLTALHITGLWLLFPETTCVYMKELKKLSLYGGEAVDEELDGEIVESYSAAREYATLIKSSDPELTQEFTNSEMYVRVTVAVMVHKLATQIQNSKPDSDGVKRHATQHSRTFGRKFLLELLTAAVEDTDLNKELYKKKSAIHRRKVRVWQMLCILSPFLHRDDIPQLTTQLKKSLHRNNMPSVRQYIESFAVQLFLIFPELIEEHLLVELHDYNMKTQALSSYVLIAANLLMGTPASRQNELLQRVLPAVLPFMTSHHHNLRSFTQVLIYRVLRHFLVGCSLPLGSQEGACLQSIADFLEGNVDCSRMRVFVEKHLDSFDPLSFTTPRGIFCSRYGEEDTAKTAEDHPFECAPVAVLDQVGLFLNEAREELRESMSADAVALTLEDNVSCKEERQYECSRDKGTGDQSHGGRPSASTPAQDDSSISHTLDGLPSGRADIQKKISSLRFSDSHIGETKVNASRISEYDAEAELLLESMESRAKELIRMRGGRQDLLVVASLVGSVPNLAGLARTCEVFKASGLVVADASIAQDRQFQLISVTAEQWIPLVEVPEAGLTNYLKRKRREGYSILGLEQTANSVSIEKYLFPEKVVLVLGRESDGIPVDIIQALDTCLEIPQLGVIRSLNVHVSGAIAVWEYTRQQLSRTCVK